VYFGWCLLSFCSSLRSKLPLWSASSFVNTKVGSFFVPLHELLLLLVFQLSELLKLLLAWSILSSSSILTANNYLFLVLLFEFTCVIPFIEFQKGFWRKDKHLFHPPSSVRILGFPIQSYGLQITIINF
jgi:hypothetical protein